MRRPLSRLAVNFTAGLAFSRLRSRLSRDFRRRRLSIFNLNLKIVFLYTYDVFGPVF